MQEQSPGRAEAPNNPFAFPPLHLRPTGTQEGTTPGTEKVELRQEQQPRTTQEQLSEQLPRRADTAKHTTPWMEEVEPRREQRSRTCDSGHPWRLDVGRIRAPKAGVGVEQLVLDLAVQFRHQSVVLQIKESAFCRL